MNTRSWSQISKVTPMLALALVVATPPALLAGETRQRVPNQDSGSAPRAVERASSHSSSGSSRGSSAATPRSNGETRSRPTYDAPSSHGSGSVRARPSSSGSRHYDGRTRVEGRGTYGRGDYSDRSYGHHSHSYYRYPYSSWRWYWSGPYFSIYCPDWWWGGPYYYGARGYDRAYDYGYGSGDGMGALDIDIAPERAQVYVDGKLVGEADDFDGFPTYLWLPKGTYDVVFYRDGYQTIARQYSIYSGVVIDVEDTMSPGTATRPEELVSKSTERRDERLRRDREREAEVDGRRQDWRERAGRRTDEPADEEEAPSVRAPYDARETPGRLTLTLEPSDASVYLDGRFLGVASELAQDHDGLILDAGRHKLEIVRPGFETKVVEFDVAAGGEAKIVAMLDEQ